MFERYTERARRCVFFARYEASVFGTMKITAEQLLLGILREDKAVVMQLNSGAVEGIRKELEQLTPPAAERVPTTVDLPIGGELRRALMLAVEEADALNHKWIDLPHLVLGLLGVDSLAANLLRTYGMEYGRYRQLVSQDTQ